MAKTTNIITGNEWEMVESTELGVFLIKKDNPDTFLEGDIRNFSLKINNKTYKKVKVAGKDAYVGIEYLPVVNKVKKITKKDVPNENQLKTGLVVRNLPKIEGPQSTEENRLQLNSVEIVKMLNRNNGEIIVWTPNFTMAKEEKKEDESPKNSIKGGSMKGAQLKSNNPKNNSRNKTKRVFGVLTLAVAGSLLAGGVYHGFVEKNKNINDEEQKPAIIEEIPGKEEKPVVVVPVDLTEEQEAELISMLDAKAEGVLQDYSIVNGKLMLCEETEKSLDYYSIDLKEGEGIDNDQQYLELKKSIASRELTKIISLSNEENLYSYNGKTYNLNGIQGVNEFDKLSSDKTVIVIREPIISQDRKSTTGWVASMQEIVLSAETNSTSLVTRKVDCKQNISQKEAFDLILTSADTKSKAELIMLNNYGPRLNPVAPVTEIKKSITDLTELETEKKQLIEDQGVKEVEGLVYQEMGADNSRIAYVTGRDYADKECLFILKQIGNKVNVIEKYIAIDSYSKDMQRINGLSNALFNVTGSQYSEDDKIYVCVPKETFKTEITADGKNYSAQLNAIYVGYSKEENPTVTKAEKIISISGTTNKEDVSSNKLVQQLISVIPDNAGYNLKPVMTDGNIQYDKKIIDYINNRMLGQNNDFSLGK